MTAKLLIRKRPSPSAPMHGDDGNGASGGDQAARMSTGFRDSVEPPMRGAGLATWSAAGISIVAGAIFLSAAGCRGLVSSLPTDETGDSRNGASSGGSGVGTGGGSNGSGGGSNPAPGVEVAVASSRAPRLSHGQYENTVKDLLGLDAVTNVTKTFVGDSTSSVFKNNGGDLVVNSDLWADYQRAAEDLAQKATASADAISRLAQGASTSDAKGFVQQLGRRAFRRPLTSAEVDSYAALFTKGATLFSDSKGNDAGVRIVLEAMLQSPNFLYRLELKDGGLTPYELASRLSYALWQTMPDTELLAAAEKGALDGDGYNTQVQRLLASDRIRDTAKDFHAQLLQVFKYADVTRATTLFPEFSPELRTSMLEETTRFTDDVFSNNGDLVQLLSAPYTFVDAKLAKVYGVSAPASGFSKVTFTDGKRAGLLTQVGFLATNSSSTQPDAIHRGTFVNFRILCSSLTPPPVAAPPLPSDDPDHPHTLRERITAFSGAGTCGASCHGTMINPAGFAFEHYDALGRWRDKEGTLPVTAVDEYSFEGTVRKYDGAVEFAKALVEAPMTHQCYARNWTEYLFGRASVPADAALTRRVGLASLQQHMPLRGVLEALVTSKPFKTRPVDP
jgi:hypothetical protein